jgi:hypothetical protein
VNRALTERHTSPFFTPALYHPFGASLYFHTLNVFSDVLALPLLRVASIATAYNTLVFGSFVLSGYAVYRLALAVVGPAAHRASFLAGVVFMCSSYRFAHLLGHLDLISTEWLAFYALFLIAVRDEARWPAVLVGGLMLAAAGLTTPYYLLFGVLLALICAVTAALFERGLQRLLIPARIATTVAVAGLIMSPVLLRMVARGSIEGPSPDPAGDAARFSVDLLAFAVPSPLHPWWGTIARRVQDAIQPHGFTLENIAYLGVVPIGLAAIRGGHAAARRFWTVSAIVFGVLALGPSLRIAGRTVPVVSAVMPYRLLAALPYGDIPRVPARFFVVTMLALSVLAAIGAHAWFARRRIGTATFVALVALVVADNTIVPMPMNAMDAPAFFARLAAEPGNAALVEVPIPDDPAIFPRRMFWQTIHGKPVFGGYLARGLPPLAFESVPGFAQFKTPLGTFDDVVRYDAAQLPAISLAVLNAYGAGVIAIEKRLMPPADAERAQRAADEIVGPSSRFFDDEFVVAYRIPPAPPLASSVVWLDRGWSYRERLGDERWHWMSDAARLGVVAPHAMRIAIRFRARAFAAPRHVRLSVGARDTGAVLVGVNSREYETPAFAVPAGATFLTWRSEEGSASPAGDPRRLSIALFELDVHQVDDDGVLTFAR